MTSSPSVNLTAEQIQDLNKQLSTMRHDINNYLSLVLAAAEVIRRKPEAVERMTGRKGGELIYLDDRPENIAAGAARGWQAVLHHDPAVSRARIAAAGLLSTN